MVLTNSLTSKSAAHNAGEATLSPRNSGMRMAILVSSIACVVAFILWTGAYLVSAFEDHGIVPPLTTIPANDSTFIFLSDTQSPLWPETLILEENQNERARSMIFTDIFAQNAGAVFHCGDLVALGFNQDHWVPIDEFTQTLARKGVPFFPVPGNHEYMIFRDSGIRNFQIRYPFASTVGYRVRLGPLAVVMLNSNIGAMTTEMVSQQDSWYFSTMDSLENDASVKGIIVACHHSPLTNSTIVDPSDDVQERFVPRYVISPKGKFFVSGHCHAFEHFHERGKDFLVIGGGGGLQQPLFMGEDQLWVDRFPRATEKRMFHHLVGAILPEGIRVTVRMLKPDFSGFEDAYSLEVPW